MKQTYSALKSLLIAVLCFAGITANAQLTGIKNIPGDYPDLATAVTDLNTQGVGAGGVTLNLIAGNPQTAPVGGYQITATGTAANTITLMGNGNTITAGLITVSTRYDAIFKLIGCDYVTLQGFAMIENPGNTTIGAIGTELMTEFGVGIFAASATDGAQNNTIQANSIALNATYQNSIGIFSTSSSSSTNGVQAATSTAGTNSSNKFYANQISNVAYGIYFICEPITATIFETGNDVGGTAAITGNTINFGCNTTSDLGWTRFSSATNGGIVFRNGAGNSIQYNTVSNNAANTFACAGILISNGTAPAGVTYTTTISNNGVTLTNSGTTATTGIDFGFGIATGTIIGSSNTVVINQAATAASGGAVTGIKAGYTSATNTCNSNNITFNQSETTGALSSVSIAMNLAGTSSAITANLNTININQNSSGTGTITGTVNGINVNANGTLTNVLNNNITVNQTTSVAAGISNNLVGVTATTATPTVNVGSTGNPNTITIKQAVTGAGTYGAGAVTYIDLGASHGVANAVSNNLNTTGSTIRSTGALIAIRCEGTVSSLYNIKANSANIDRVATAGAVNFTYQTGGPSNVADTVSNNIITFTNIATTGAVTGIQQSGGPTTPAANNKSICNNTINISGTFTGTTIGITYGYSQSAMVRGNSITINSASTSSTGITMTTGVTSSSIIGNTINLSSSSTTATLMAGITASIGGPHTITNNQIATLNLSGVLTSSPSVYGISVSVSAANNISQNTISGITAGGVGTTGNPTVDGILVSAGTTTTISKNKIYGIVSNSTGTTGQTSGIRISAGTTFNVNNNIIGNFTAPASANAAAIRGINITSATASSTLNIYYNTVYLNASSSGANFGSSCLFHTVSATATTAALDLRNNLFVNLSTANGTGFTVAYRRSGTALNNFAASSNNNAYYAGTPSATNLIFYDGTTSAQTLAAYQALVAARDNAAVTENPSFVSLVGSNAGFLHINQVSSLLESGGTTIGGLTVDYDNDTRPGPVGSVNGGALAPDIGADEFDGFPAFCSGTPTAGTASVSAAVCGSGTFNLTDAGASSGPGITYQWQSSAVSGGPYSNISGATSTAFTTGTISTTTYFVCVVTCTNSASSVTTNEVVGTVNPSPTVTVTPTAGSICLPGGSPVTLTANGGISYTWSPTTGLTPTTGSPVSANPAVTTTYTVTGTAANGCTGTATATITVGQNPNISSVTATPASVCSGGNSQLTATANSGDLVSSYSFSTSTGAALDPMTGATTVIGTGDDDTPTASPAAIGFTFPYNGTTYTQYSVSPDGWILLGGTTALSQFTNAVTSTTNIPKIYPYWDDLATGTTGSVQTLVTGSAPNRILKVQWFITSPRATGSPANGTFQAWLYETSGVIEFRYGALTASGTGASCGLTASATNFQSVTISSNTSSNAVANDANAAAPASGRMYTFTPPALSYAWTPATFLSSTSIYNPAANGVTATTTYTATVTSAVGCVSTGTVTLTSGSALAATSSIAPGNTVCQGTNVTLSATPTGGGAPYTYSWSGPSSFSSTLQNPVINGATPAATGTYTCVVTDNCTSTFTVTVALTVNPAPSVSVTPTTAVFCSAGSPVALTASGSATTYGWAPPAGLSATTGTNVTAGPTATTTYTVTGTDGIGCTATATTTITYAETPTIASVTATPATLCNGNNSQLNATATTTTYAVSNPAFTLDPCQSTAGPTGDDVVQGPDNIGFNFSFFGNTYTQFGLSTNGNIQLGNGSGSANNPVYSNSWTDVAIPNAATPNNMIALAWDDWLISAGQITYGTTGSAPNRKLIICFNTTGRGSGNADTLNGQIVLEETTNNVYLNITRKGVSTNTCTQGIENAAGTFGYPVAGRNNVAWSTNNNTMLFAPPTISYSWTPTTFLSSSTISNPMANAMTSSTTYSVTATANGCSANGSVPVIVNPTPTITATAGSGAICNGSSTTLTGNGGTTYTWMPGSLSGTTVTVSPTTTTTYTVTGTDASGCNNTGTVTVIVNPNPTVNASASANPVCAGTSTTLTGSGATSYSWSGGVTDGVSFVPASTTTYTVTGTDGNGCTGNNTITVTVNALPAVVANTTASAVCTGNSVTLTGSGAASYTWSGGVTDGVAFVPASTTTYTVTGTDANSCVNTSTVTVAVNANPVVVANTTASTICDGNNITLTGSGASTYSWSGGVMDGVSFSPSGTTTYTVTGTDGNGCTGTDNITINVNPNPTVTATASATSVCSGTTVTLTGSGATSYSWSGGVTDGVAFTPSSSTTYTVTGTDGNGCTGADVINITVNPLPTVVANTTATVICTGGSVTLTGSGTATSYTWSGGVTDGVAFIPSSTTTYTVTGTNGNGCTNTDMVTVTVNPTITVTANATSTAVCSGNSVTLTGSGAATYSWSGGVTDGVAFIPTSTTTYTVTGSSGAGCTDVATITITVNTPPTVTANASSTTVCSGDMVTFNGNGASTYAWSGGVTDGVPFTMTSSSSFTVTGTDANGCTGTDNISVTVNALPTVSASVTNSSICAGNFTTVSATGASTYDWMPGTFSGSSVSVAPASSTTYTVTGTDANGCFSTSTVAVTVNALPTVTATTANSAVCAGSSTTLTGSGASTYNWMPGSLNGTTVSVMPSSATTYTVTGVDANGCAASETVTVTVNAVPVVDLGPDIAQCSGTVALDAGNAGSTFMWNDNSTAQTLTASNTGTYWVDVTNAAGCTTRDSVNITINANPVVNLGSDIVQCGGSATLDAGNPGATYAWSTSESTQQITVTSSGTYSVIATLTGGCTATGSINVTINSLPTVNLGPDIAQCSGTAMLDAGNAGSNYMWNDNSTAQTLTASSTGIYWVDVTDGNGCTSRDSVSVTINSNPVVDLGADITQCGGTVVLDAGNAGATYSWSTTETTQMITVSTSGTYSVIATLTGGCTATDVINITINTPPTVTVTFPTDTVCLNGGLFTLTGESPAGGVWSGNGVSGNSFDPQAAGLGFTNVDYTYTDVNGCSSTASNQLWVDVCNDVVSVPVELMSVEAYPNPNAGIFTIKVNNPNADEMRLDIMDVEGRLIYSEQLIGVTNGYTKQIDLSNMANGAYFMRVNAKNDVKTIKLFKQG